MEIQISVIIWTVINFCIIMIILRLLLFKPLFAVMDGRSEKIKKAKLDFDDARAEIEARINNKNEENEHLLNTAREKALKDAEEAEEHLNLMISEHHEALITAEAENNDVFDKESVEILASLDGNIDELTVAYAKMLTGNGKTVCRGSDRITNVVK